MPGFAVRMTSTPVVVGAAACVWEGEGWDMVAAPMRGRLSAMARLRMAFTVLGIGIVPGVLTRCSVAIVGRLLVIIFTNYEAELHSQAGRVGWRRGVPRRRTPSQLSESRRRTRRDDIRREPGHPGAGGAGRRGAIHPNHAKRRIDRGWRAISCPRKAGVRRTRVCKRSGTSARG